MLGAGGMPTAYRDRDAMLSSQHALQRSHRRARRSSGALRKVPSAAPNPRAVEVSTALQAEAASKKARRMDKAQSSGASEPVQDALTARRTGFERHYRSEIEFALTRRQELQADVAWVEEDARRECENARRPETFPIQDEEECKGRDAGRYTKSGCLLGAQRGMFSNNVVCSTREPS